jgi:glucose 1-dehydrogenase
MTTAKKVALITGSSQGIGLACAVRMAKDGAAVMLSDVTAEKGAAAVSAIRAAGGTAQFTRCDVAQKTEVDALITATVAAFGGIDILVNNAGVIDTAEFIDLSIEEFDRVIGINLRGAFLVAQGAARQMVKQVQAGKPPGAIINMSSVNAHFGLPDHVAYSMSKGGMKQLTAAAAMSLSKYRIRVNAIGPGTINTEIVKAVADNPAAMAKLMSRTPLGRMGEPSEIASIAVFLASDESSYITGQTIYPDGGRMVLNYTV